MLSQMAELRLRYPEEAQRVATEALPVLTLFLTEVPDLKTLAKWLQFNEDEIFLSLLFPLRRTLIWNWSTF